MANPGIIKGSQPLDLPSGFGDLCAETDDKSKGFSTLQALLSAEQSEQAKPVNHWQSPRLCQ